MPVRLLKARKDACMEFEVNEDSSPRTPESPIRVLVVDDQPLIRRGLALMLGLEHDIEVVAQAANGEEAVTLARQWRPHVVLMDMKMPVMGGVAATRAITAALGTPRNNSLSAKRLIRKAVGSSRPDTRFSNVDLPHPE